jgi:hypothetical protein
MSIRNACLVLYMEEDTSVCDQARRGVKIIGENILGCGIGKVHGFVVFTPAQTVGDCDFLNHSMECTVWIESEKDS